LGSVPGLAPLISTVIMGASRTSTKLQKVQ
jgi:hypothetical protein